MAKKKKDPTDRIVAYKSFFDTENGREILFDLMKRGHFMHTSWDGGDVHNLVFNEGQRDMVNYILTMTNQDPVAIRDFIKSRESEEMTYDF